MRKILCVALSMLLCMSVSGHAYAKEVDKPETMSASVVLNSQDKIAFKNEKDQLYREQQGKDRSYTEANQEIIDKLIEQATVLEGEEQKAVLRELEQYGVFKYETRNESASDETNSRSSSSAVRVYAPSIFYTSSNNTWTITTSGMWVNNTWAEQVGPGNVGGADAFGVGFTNVSGTSNTHITSSYAYIADQNSNTAAPTYSRSDGEAQKGFGFRLQDYIYLESPTSDALYMGYRWYGRCVYASGFEYLNGIATSYYIHSWAQATIRSLTFGAQGQTAGISLEIDYQQYSFPAYSNDKIF